METTLKTIKPWKSAACRKWKNLFAVCFVIPVALSACGNTKPPDLPKQSHYEVNEPEVSDPGTPVSRPPINKSEDDRSEDWLPTSQDSDNNWATLSEEHPEAVIFGGYANMAQVVLVVDKAMPKHSPTGQSVTIFKGGVYQDTYAVSTGQEKWLTTSSGESRWTGTPLGYYRPKRLYREYHSKSWDGAPMPDAVFFNGGIAFHGTQHLKDLGSRASGGCIRLRPEHARKLRVLIQNTGTPESYWEQNQDIESEVTPGEVLGRTLIRGTGIELPNIDPGSGEFLMGDIIWTWDVVVVVLDQSV